MKIIDNMDELCWENEEKGAYLIYASRRRDGHDCPPSPAAC
jgi:hypothetical protein